MSDKTWYLFGETLKRHYENRGRDITLHFQYENEINEFTDLEKEYRNGRLQGYLDAMCDATGYIDKLYTMLDLKGSVT